MKKYIVYKHTSPSNKIYIGITCQDVERRWRNGDGYKSQKYFYRAIKKYGWDNFEHIILYKNLEERQAKVLEMALIHYYDSTNPNLGYNLTKGGEGHFGYHPSEETKKKLSENNAKYWKGKHLSEETKKKLSEVNKGENNPNYGKHISDEHKKRISEANSGRQKTEEEREKISKKAIDRYKDKENHPNYGKHHSEETKKKMSDAKKGKLVGSKNGKSKKVICITTMMVFDCISQGALFYNIAGTNITKCCKDKMKFCGKLPDGTPLVWKYITIIEL